MRKAFKVKGITKYTFYFIIRYMIRYNGREIIKISRREGSIQCSFVTLDLGSL